MDRISRLPDELLCNILSFFTTKEAALTSVLSKRWRNLFALVPCLEIDDDSNFLHPEEDKRERDENLESFMDFVDRVLALHGDSPIKKFSLKCQDGVDSDRVNKCIRNVLQRDVLVMDLSFINLGYEYKLPSEIFMSRALVALKITNGFYIKLQRLGDISISLPMLKTLALDTIIFSYDGQLQKLISACPSLEELALSNIYWSYRNETVSSATLKTLKIKSANIFNAFSFDTPNLVCLSYSELVTSDYPLVNFEKLVEAKIELMLTYYDRARQLIARENDWLEDDVFLKLGKVQKLFRGICNVKKLYLSPDALQVLALCCQAMPVFNNLTFLDIDSNTDIAWQAMPVLLRNCPNLETLVIKGGLLHCVTEKCGDCISREEKGRWLGSCPVKKLEIRWFGGIKREVEMIKHFYDYFPCLEEMEIYVDEASPFQDPKISESNLYKVLSGRNVKVTVHDPLHRLAAQLHSYECQSYFKFLF